MSGILFSSDIELSKFLGSVDIIPEAYQAISDTNSAYEVHTTGSGFNVLAFNCSPYYTTRFLQGEFGLLSSKNLQLLDFISSKVNPTFSINEAAVELFQELGDDLKELENKYINTSLIITGSGLGGYLAVLSTLRLHHAIDVEESNGSRKTKRPICITFGCPLVGDEALQRAISERPQWKLSFLNVVAKKDVVASYFSLDTAYNPFGTFLFCTESGGHVAFEDHASVLAVLYAMYSLNEGNMQICDYNNVLSPFRRKVLYRGVSELGEFDLNLLRAGITLQLRDVGVLDGISDYQIGKMDHEKKQTVMIRRMNAAYDPTKKLNDMNLSLIYMEWYMKTRKAKGGYYDVYKDVSRDEINGRQEIVSHHGRLNNYWKKVVEENDKMPQKEGAKLRKRWLYGGTTYRRIVEPLDIAKFYQNGNINYIENRLDHYKLLEKWLNEDKKDAKSSEVTRNQGASLTEDSCFWAHVEEALISLRNLDGGPNSIEKDLEQFEAYVMRAIKNYSVSPDIFLEGSSFMDWWNKYKAHKGTAYASKLAQYMNNEIYKFYE